MCLDTRVTREPRVRALWVLVCDPGGASDGRPSPGKDEWVHSAVHCLHRAVDGAHDVVVVCFGDASIGNRAALVELCAALKQNSHTRERPVLALIRARHRGLIEDLERAQVDFVCVVGEADLDPAAVRAILQEVGPDDELPRFLDTLCPLIHYCADDAEHELAVCGGYLDRLVLGGNRLRRICETREHLRCEYFLSPKPKRTRRAGHS